MTFYKSKKWRFDVVKEAENWFVYVGPFRWIFWGPLPTAEKKS